MATLNIDVRLNDQTAAGFKKIREELRRLQAEANRVTSGMGSGGPGGTGQGGRASTPQQQTAAQTDRIVAERQRTRRREKDAEVRRDREQIRETGRLQREQEETAREQSRQTGRTRRAEVEKETAVINSRGRILESQARTEEQRVRNRGRAIDAQDRKSVV